MKKILLSVAGFDPTSGAGVLLDLKVFDQLGFRGMAVLSAVTAQNTSGIQDIHCLLPDFLKAQYEVVSQDIGFSGIKIGMVGCRQNIPVITRILEERSEIPKVVDPVFRSSSGTWLLEEGSIPEFIAGIRGRATLLTPNLDEATLITGRKIENPAEMKESVQILVEHTEMACLLKGGHLKDKAVDILFDGKDIHHFERAKIDKRVHGTGCLLSSSILCFLVQGKSLKEACRLATQLVQRAIVSATAVGRGQLLITFPLWD